MKDSSYVLVSRDGSVDNENISTDGDLKYLPDLDKTIEGLKEPLWRMNKHIHDNPELGFEEYDAQKTLTDFLRSQDGWEVATSVHGMDTAWIATYDSKKQGPVVSFNAEMDALPKLGHACGHNLIATASIAAGVATAQLIKEQDLSGKVMIFGTPAEEGGGGGKIRLLEAGAYKDVDISLISHPGLFNNSPMVRTTAYVRLEAEYVGRAAHAANSPWLGINALDALVIAYNAVSVLRQQTMPGDVIGMQITNGGAAPNIIHAYASGAFVIRATTSSRLNELEKKVKACIRAGEEATGARAEIRVIKGYADHVPNCVLAASYIKYWNQLPDVPEPPIPPPGQFTFVKASTDQGNLSYAMPSVNASFAIPPGMDHGPNHTPDFERASGTEEAFNRALRVGKALAGTAVDVLYVPELLDEVKRQWKRDMERLREGQSLT